MWGEPHRRRRRPPSNRGARGAKVGIVPSAPHKLTLGLLTVAGISFAIMQTLVVPSLPFFVSEFGSSPAWATWLVTSFLVSSSVLTPIIGKLGDAHGKKKLLVVSLGIFGFASLGATLAPSIGVLIAFRALQGAGAAI